MVVKYLINEGIYQQHLIVEWTFRINKCRKEVKLRVDLVDLFGTVVFQAGSIYHQSHCPYSDLALSLFGTNLVVPTAGPIQDLEDAVQ